MRHHTGNPYYDYFNNQTGGGDFIGDYRRQVGTGLGALFSSIARAVIPLAKTAGRAIIPLARRATKTLAPIAKSAAKSAIKGAVSAGADVLSDVLNDKDFKSSVQQRSSERVKHFKRKMAKEIKSQIPLREDDDLPPPKKKKKKIHHKDIFSHRK